LFVGPTWARGPFPANARLPVSSTVKIVTNGLRGLRRFQRALRNSVGFGLKSWTISKLRERDPRFDGVWTVADNVPGWFNEINAVAIFQILAELKPMRVVEIGSYMGRSTVFFACSLLTLGAGGRVTAIDPHSGDRQHREGFGMSEIPSFDMFRTHIELAGVEEIVDPIVATSSEAAREWTEPFQFLFVDGWHGYDAVLADGREWAAKLDEGGVVVFDDALQYDEVRQAINDLDSEGTIHLWGHFYGQALAGRSPTPPACVVQLIADGRIEKIGRRIETRLTGTQ
jgi:cephalosporin hydroxylase